MSARFSLHKSMFGESERLLCRMGEFAVSTFRYDSGIEALRAKNTRGEIIVLPFKGQQIWRAIFDGRDLTMKSMFEEPVATATYLETYGAFFIHCGITGMGAPGPADRHPLHGELPNAPFQYAWLELDEAEKRLTVGGAYRHTVAFASNYRATAEIALLAGSALIDASLTVENLKKTPMDLMYLGHANFRPDDYGELHYTAPYAADAVRVRRSIPGHITPKPGYAEFVAELANDPSIHHTLKPGLAFDPEIVFTIAMQPGDDGFAHTLQKRRDGTADYIRYRPSQAPICMRWISRTPDQDAIGMAFPSTSEVEGHAAEKAKGQVAVLDGGKTWRVDMRMGHLAAAETTAVAAEINRIRAANGVVSP